MRDGYNATLFVSVQRTSKEDILDELLLGGSLFEQRMYVAPISSRCISLELSACAVPEACLDSL